MLGIARNAPIRQPGNTPIRNKTCRLISLKEFERGKRWWQQNHRRSRRVMPTGESGARQRRRHDNHHRNRGTRFNGPDARGSTRVPGTLSTTPAISGSIGSYSTAQNKTRVVRRHGTCSRIDE